MRCSTCKSSLFKSSKLPFQHPKAAFSEAQSSPFRSPKLPFQKPEAAFSEARSSLSQRKSRLFSPPKGVDEKRESRSPSITVYYHPHCPAVTRGIPLLGRGQGRHPFSFPNHSSPHRHNVLRQQPLWRLARASDGNVKRPRPPA